MDDLFPVVDLSCLKDKYTLAAEWQGEEFKNDTAVQKLVNKISDGFETWGFLYVKGHGISQDLIENSFTVSKSFFKQNLNFKNKFRRDSGISVGYVPHAGEIFDAKKPNDLKEAFDFVAKSYTDTQLSKEMPGFVNVLGELFKEGSVVLNKILRLLALALGINSEHFIDLHSKVGDRKFNGTSLRTLFYPNIQQEVEESQERCSEHTDYGSITLLFQDSIGGLEVMSPAGKFIKAIPIPGTIVVNAADLLYAWSNRKFKATIHRVVIPNDTKRLSLSRQSIAFFVHPNYDVNIKYFDENGEKKERNAYDHLKKRFATTIVSN